MRLRTGWFVWFRGANGSMMLFGEGSGVSGSMCSKMCCGGLGEKSHGLEIYELDAGVGVLIYRKKEVSILLGIHSGKVNQYTLSKTIVSIALFIMPC